MGRYWWRYVTWWTLNNVYSVDREAFGFLTVDDKVLISILTRRTFRERDLIKQAFARLTGSVSASNSWPYKKKCCLNITVIHCVIKNTSLLFLINHSGRALFGLSNDVIVASCIMWPVERSYNLICKGLFIGSSASVAQKGHIGLSSNWPSRAACCLLRA